MKWEKELRWCRIAGAVLCLAAGIFMMAQKKSIDLEHGDEKNDRGQTEEVIKMTASESRMDSGEPFGMAERELKKIALTFDDGPHPIYTEEMLDLLEKEQVPATFFLLGQNVEEYGEVVRKIADKGHLIGNHTYHHVQITTLPTDQAYEEIDKTSRLIEELTGKGTEYVRPPFGTWNEGLESELDLIPVMWTIDTLDWTTGNVDWIVNKVVKDAGENDIILMHDSYKSTVQAVERIIEILKADGFEFVTVDEVIMD